MILRPYQDEAKDSTVLGFESVNKQLVVIPTGGGKTILFAHLAAHYAPRRTLILAHRKELLDQAKAKIEAAVGLRCEIEKAEQRASMDAQVVIASVQTMAGRADRWPPDHFHLVVVDEAHHCCPAGTLVDGRPIETIKAGDLVTSYSHLTGLLEAKPVLAVMSRPADSICVINLADGRRIICTPDHPIWNGEDYIDAAMLSCNNMVYEAASLLSLQHRVPSEVVEQHNDPLLFSALQSQGKRGEAKNSSYALLGVPSADGSIWEKIISGFKRAALLLKGMFTQKPSALKLANNGSHESQARIQADAGKQPDATARCVGKDAPKNDGKAIQGAGRKWKTDKASDSNDDCITVDGCRAHSGASNRNEAGAEHICGTPPDLLQVGHCNTSSEAIHRDRREGTQAPKKQSVGCPQNQSLRGVRVERVEVYERGRDPQFFELCPHGVVFNIEVEENNNFFAEGILTHNCLADSYRAVLSRFEGHAKILGVTATPDRGDKKNLGQYFDRIAYEVSLLRLIKDNYLAPIKIRTLPVRVDLSGVKRVAGDFSADDLAAKIEPWLERVATAMAIECWDRKTVVFLPLVKTAERMADILGRVGLQARCVSGYDDDRESTLRWFAEAGPGSVLCNSMLLTEGWDQPDVDCIVNLRPTAVRALFAQMVGRGTRIHPGKQDLLLLDFLWQTERLALVSAASLITGNADDVKQAQTALAGGDEVDLVQVCASVEEQRMRKVVAALKENRKRKPGTYEALELCVAISAVELADFEPLNEREARPATARQIAALEKAGFSANGIKCFGHASAILDRLAVRRMEGLATPKQVRMLVRFHHPSPETASFEEASAWLNREFGARRNAA